MRRCSRCHQGGHDRRSQHCPAHQANNGRIYMIEYRIFQLGNFGIPNLHHHAIVHNGNEYGFGREGPTVRPCGTYYGNRYNKIVGYTLLPEAFQCQPTDDQIDAVLAQLYRQGFRAGNYCLIHKNCLKYTQSMLSKLLARNHRRMPRPRQYPNCLKDYPVREINAILRAMGLTRDHPRGRHECIFLSEARD